MPSQDVSVSYDAESNAHFVHAAGHVHITSVKGTIFGPNGDELVPRSQIKRLYEMMLIDEATKESQRTLGAPVRGKGLYLGSIVPQIYDDNTVSTGREFHVYAAPEDMNTPPKLSNLYMGRVGMNFNAAAKYLPTLQNWHGHDGADFGESHLTYEKNLIQAIQQDNLDEVGKWHVPTLQQLKLIFGNSVKYELKDSLVSRDKPFNKKYYTSSSHTTAWGGPAIKAATNLGEHYNMDLHPGGSHPNLRLVRMELA